jgi:hypothetical protein
MRTVTETAVIERPQAELFQAAADPERQLVWDSGTLKSVEKLSPGPLGRGSRYRGGFKGFGTVVYEFAEFEAPRRFAHLARMPMGEMRHTFTFEPANQGTRMTQTGELRPNLLGRLMGPMIAWSLGKRFRTIADELGSYLAARER